MPTYKRYIMRDGVSIRFFSSKPISFGHTHWIDYAYQRYKIASIHRNEVDNYDELLKLPNKKLIEVEMKIKVKV